MSLFILIYAHMPITVPHTPRVISKEGAKAVIEVEGLYPGYGMTLGNALRRVLLSSLEGAAVTVVKIKGASHEFSTIPSVMEDVVQILLNIKRLRFTMHSDEAQTVTIKVQGERTVTAEDIEAPSQVTVMNTTAHIATLTDKKATFEVEMTIEKGFGYVPVEARRTEKMEVGTIALDAIFTPIRKINYEVENMRVGDRTDYNRLRFMIETDGTISPEDAFTKGATILVEQFKELSSFAASAESATESVVAHSAANEGEESHGVSIADLGLSTRVAHALENAGIATVGDLTQRNEADVDALEGMGEKGMTDLKKAMKKLGVQFAG